MSAKSYRHLNGSGPRTDFSEQTRAVIAALSARRGRDGWYYAKCPAHDDKHASLSFREGKNDGRPVFKCKVGCSQAELEEALIRDGVIEPRHKRDRAIPEELLAIAVTMKATNWSRREGRTMLAVLSAHWGVAAYKASSTRYGLSRRDGERLSGLGEHAHRHATDRLVNDGWLIRISGQDPRSTTEWRIQLPVQLRGNRPIQKGKGGTCIGSEREDASSLKPVQRQILDALPRSRKELTSVLGIPASTLRDNLTPMMKVGLVAENDDGLLYRTAMSIEAAARSLGGTAKQEARRKVHDRERKKFADRKLEWAEDKREREELENIRAAQRIWQKSQAAKGTITEKYLRGRGITDPIPADIRHAYFKGRPCMVAAVRDLVGNLVAVQLTPLLADGSGRDKSGAPRYNYGSFSRGGAVRLGKAGFAVALAEGVETGLSVAQLYGNAVYVVLGAENLEKVQIPVGVHDVYIAVDNDPAGIRHAREAALRFRTSGCDVFFFHPGVFAPNKCDFNDVIDVPASIATVGLDIL